MTASVFADKFCVHHPFFHGKTAIIDVGSDGNGELLYFDGEKNQAIKISNVDYQEEYDEFSFLCNDSYIRLPLSSDEQECVEDLPCDTDLFAIE